MQALVSFAAVAALVAPSLVAAVPLITKRHAEVKVELSKSGATEVTAVMTNTGVEALKLLDYGTLMDKKPVQKLNVFKDGVEVPFTGLGVRYKMYDFSEDAFTTLAPGEAFTTVINVAAVHDVSGGDLTVSTIGAIPYAAPSTTEIAGSIAYESNVLSFALADSDVALVSRTVPLLDKRTALKGCSGSENTEHRQSLKQVVSVAQAAAAAARNGSAAKFQEFFKTTSASARTNVAARLDAVSHEASTTSNGATTYYCDDQYNYCDSNTLAYTLPSQNVIANCPLYYTLSSLTGNCRQQDQTTTALHEFTHAPGVFSPGTQDYAYGYSAATRLSSTQALANADTYALYANAIINGC